MGFRNLGGVKILGYAKGSIATATTTALDFGSPNDLHLPALAGMKHNDRILVVITSTTVGTTNTTGWTIQDADDNAGSIGTPATAVTTVLDGAALTGGVGDQHTVVEVTVNPERPWLRINMTRASGTTDTTVVTALVLAVPASV